MDAINLNSEDDKKEVTRRDFIVLTASAMTAVGAASFVFPLVDSLNPSADVLALGSIDVDLTHIAEGQIGTFMWRGKPVFVRHRTQDEIKAAESVNLQDLKDPQTDGMRVKKGYEKWLVTIGICTHLGCVPVGKQGEYGGWFCPCHGSVYDTSGRIRKGPAPLNLEVPEYTFLTDTKIKIG